MINTFERKWRDSKPKKQFTLIVNMVVINSTLTLLYYKHFVNRVQVEYEP